MNAIPAQIAGVEDIVMVTPPGRDGAVSPAILAAAQVAGVTQIFKCGGAQAIAALAYGTGDHSPGGQDRGSGQRLCGRGEEAGSLAR